MAAFFEIYNGMLLELPCEDLRVFILEFLVFVDEF